MADPFEALRRRDVPIAPRTEFADELRARLVPKETAVEHGTVTPYLCVDGAERAIEWYREQLDARVVFEPMVMDDGRVDHAEIAIGGSVLMLSDEFTEIGVRAPTTLGGTPVSLAVTVTDADATFAAAVAAGATAERPVADQPHGVRSGWLIDPFGHRWNVQTPI
ncbi:MAG: VOC family protein [Actinomycetota bacterium]